MSDTTLAPANGGGAAIMERVLLSGDLQKLTPQERTTYYMKVCDSVGLNPLTRPFEYIILNGKLTLYARKDCTEQLRQIKNVSVRIMSREVIEDCYIVTAKASMPGGREDESTGAVNIAGIKGEARANAMMKAETKAKRRVTLSICGLGLLDESETESIPGAKPFTEDPADPPARTWQDALAAAFEAEAYDEEMQENAVAAILGRYKVASLDQLNDVQRKRTIEAIHNGQMMEAIKKTDPAVA